MPPTGTGKRAKAKRIAYFKMAMIALSIVVILYLCFSILRG
jgi:hypothetical protein